MRVGRARTGLLRHLPVPDAGAGLVEVTLPSGERHNARRDPRTDPTHRRVHPRPGAELADDRRPAIAAVVDIDDVPKRNDQCGRPAGDTVPRAVPRRPADHAGDDLVTRQRGGECAVPLTGVAIDVARGRPTARLSTVPSTPIPTPGSGRPIPPRGTADRITVTVIAPAGPVPVPPGARAAGTPGRADREERAARSARCREPKAAPAPRPPDTASPDIPRQPAELARSKAGGS